MKMTDEMWKHLGYTDEGDKWVRVADGETEAFNKDQDYELVTVFCAVQGSAAIRGALQEQRNEQQRIATVLGLWRLK